MLHFSVSKLFATEPRISIMSPLASSIQTRGFWSSMEGVDHAGSVGYIVICQIKCPFGSGYGSKGDGTIYGKKHQDEFIQVRSPLSVAEFTENSR